MTRPATLARDTIAFTEAATPDAVGRLREAVAKQLDDWGIDESVIFTAGLVASELLTNALKHGHAQQLVLRLARTGTSLLRLEADDPDREHWPRVTRSRDPESKTGRGMLLVHELTDQWGVIATSVKTVYADIALVTGE